MSTIDTKHVANILKDPRVSVAIYSYPGPPGGNIGLQIKGKAEEITKPHGDASGGWLYFKIIPEEVWLFDSRVFNRRQKVNLSDLKLDQTDTILINVNYETNNG